MKFDNKWVSILVVVIATLIAQFPAVNHWIDEATTSHTHIVTLVEGIVGILLLLWATKPGAAAAPPAPHAAVKP